MVRIGPKMRLAVELVTRHPGEVTYYYAKQLHRACAAGRNNALGYEPVNRAIRAGLIRVEQRGNRTELYPVASNG